MSFNDLLKSYKTSDKGGITHTRIPGGNGSGIYGGKFCITSENTKLFMDKYFDHVITNHNPEYSHLIKLDRLVVNFINH